MVGSYSINYNSPHSALIGHLSAIMQVQLIQVLTLGLITSAVTASVLNPGKSDCVE